MPETTPQEQLNDENLDERIEALLAEMQAACDRVSAELEGDQKLSAEDEAAEMVASGGPIDDRGESFDSPADTPAEPADAEPEAESEPTPDVEPGAEAEPVDEPKPEVDPEPEPESAADGNWSAGEEDEQSPSDLDAQVGAMIDDALQAEDPGAPVADPEPESPAEAAVDEPDDSTDEPASEPTSEASPEADAPAPAEPAPEPSAPPGDVDDLDAELAALAGEMLENAEPEAIPQDTERPVPQPSGTPAAAEAPATTDPDASTETEDDAARDAAPDTGDAETPGTAPSTPAKPKRSLGFPARPTAPTLEPKTKPTAVASAYAKTYLPWLLACALYAGGRVFVWAAVRLGELAAQSNKPIEARSKSFQHTVGWAAVVTGFNATLAWGFLLFIREPKSPPPNDTPRVEINADQAAADAQPAE